MPIKYAKGELKKHQDGTKKSPFPKKLGTVVKSMGKSKTESKKPKIKGQK